MSDDIERISALRAESAGKRPAFERVLTDEQIIAAWDAQWRYHGHEPCKLSHVEFARTVEVMVAARCRAEGGITNLDGIPKYEWWLISRETEEEYVKVSDVLAAIAAKRATKET